MKIRTKLPKLDLNITNKCNLRCKHCAFDSGCSVMEEMSLEEITKILEETKELGGRRIDITGGEPLMRKDVRDVIVIGKDLDYKIELVTNGTLANYSLLKNFRELELDGIAVSIDGASNSVHSRIRNTSVKQFERSVQTLREAVNLGYYVKVNTLAAKCNYQNIPEITKLCLELGVQEHGIYYFTPVGRGQGFLGESIEPKEWLRFLREDMIYPAELEVSFEFPFIETENVGPRSGCITSQERSHLQILPTGETYPCAIMASYGISLGNLKTDSIKKIWNNKKLWDEYEANTPTDCCFKVSSEWDLDGLCFVCPLKKYDCKQIGR